MLLEELREYCLSKPGTTEGLPFDEHTLVFKVMNKMFALCGIEDFQSINLKCDPETAIELRERYEAVKPGYHMSKKHWNTITVGLDMPDDEIYQWVDHSYEAVVTTLTKKVKLELEQLNV
jgi:predicted DNA-binding protein (MmcQ/YjbR family)